MNRQTPSSTTSRDSADILTSYPEAGGYGLTGLRIRDDQADAPYTGKKSGIPVDHPEQQAVYAQVERDELLNLLPHPVSKVLDVGCGKGGFGISARRRLGEKATIVGIEPVHSSADEARSTGVYSEILEGYFPDVLDSSDVKYDLIVFNDVLEHVVDPWHVLETCSGRLAEGGILGAVIPSVQYAPVIWGLLKGRWDYKDTGVLDRTHLRFFTKATVRELFESNGYSVNYLAMGSSIVDKWKTDPLLPRRMLKRVLAGLLGDRAYMHVIVLASPDSSRR